MCDFCHAHERNYWGPSSFQPALETVENGDWISLQRCPLCGAYWVCSPYEPYASFPYLALWPWSAAKWSAVHAKNAWATLHPWHKLSIRASYLAEPTDIAEIEKHRARSGQHNPIDYPVGKSLAEVCAIIEATPS